MIVVLIICLAIQSAFYILIFSRLALYNPIEKERSGEKLSIVICFKNEEKNILERLPFILEQESTEIILVNDNSTDNTFDLLSKHASDRVKVISTTEESKGKKHALLSGLKYATNESIVLTDADCMPASNSWSSMLNSYAAPFVLGYGPMQKTAGLISIFSRFETYMTALQYLSFALVGMPYMGVGRNLKVDKSIILKQRKKIKGQNLASGDDDLMINALSTKDNTIICIEPESFVYSKPKATLSAFLKQKRRHISASHYYKPIHKFLLSIFSGSYILFFLVLVTGIITRTLSIKMALIILLTKWLIQQIINFRVMKKLKEEDLFWKFPFLDIMFFVYLLIMPFYYLFNKKNSSWS